MTDPKPSETSDNKPNDLSHPVYKKISAANGRINRMDEEQLCEALSYLKLLTKGSKEVLSKRLKEHVKKQHLIEQKLKVKKEKFDIDYYIVIDFEATCEEKNPEGYLHEIIEFPAVLLEASTLKIVSEFHHYCRPVINPILSEFCKHLTGITQMQVDSAAPFPTILRRFDDWLKEQVQPKDNFCIATDGHFNYWAIKTNTLHAAHALIAHDGSSRPWDINRFLKMQCKQLKLDIPYYFHRWVNVRKHFNNFYKIHQVNVELMLQHLGMEFEGRPHCGIDDTRNIARILIQLRRDGAEMCINETFK